MVDQDEERKEEEVAEITSPVRHSLSTGRDDQDTGRHEEDPVREVSPDIFPFLNMACPGKYKEGPVQDDFEPGKILGVIEGESRTTIKPNRNYYDFARETACYEWKNDDPWGFDQHPEWENEEVEFEEFEELYPVRYDQSPGRDDSQEAKGERPKKAETGRDTRDPVRYNSTPVRDNLNAGRYSSSETTECYSVCKKGKPLIGKQDYPP